MFSGVKLSLKGTTGLLVAVALVVAVLVFFPAYRLFFAVSVLLGLLVAVLLSLRNKYLPLKERDVDHKRPLGL